MRERRRAVLLVVAMSTAGCGLVQGHEELNGRELPPLRELEPPPSLFVEGEVRDARTLAPIADAEITIRGEPAGPASTAVVARTGADGRFAVTFDRVREQVRPGWLDETVFGTEPHDEWVNAIVVAVTAKDRCTAPRRYGVHEVPKPLTVWMSPCATGPTPGAR
jgi:hypothetical protein